MGTNTIRASFDDDLITVYQAFSPSIAVPAVEQGRFVPPFSMDRMSWIKPSFLWMMYRCGWASKPGQERVLAIQMRRDGFEAALSRACLSSFHPGFHPSHEAWREQLAASDVRIQWDPERDPDGAALDHRSIQIGLSKAALHDYVHHWVVSIHDITDDLPAYRTGERPLPRELPYPLPVALTTHIGAD